MPFTMISERKNQVSSPYIQLAKSLLKFVRTLKTDIAGRGVHAETSFRGWVRAPELDEGTNVRETSSFSWKRPADLVQFLLRRRLDARRCSDMRNALPMPRVSEEQDPVSSATISRALFSIFDDVNSRYICHAAGGNSRERKRGI